jgi:hypothetical protein
MFLPVATLGIGANETTGGAVSVLFQSIHRVCVQYSTSAILHHTHSPSITLNSCISKYPPLAISFIYTHFCIWRSSILEWHPAHFEVPYTRAFQNQLKFNIETVRKIAGLLIEFYQAAHLHPKGAPAYTC